MQHRYLLILIFQLCSSVILSQLDEDPLQIELNNDAINLVSDIFITGSCKNISNIQSSGSRESFGVFKDAENIIGFAEGIILSTGDAREAEGPNDSIETSTRFDRPSADQDLIEIATDELYDVTVLEFDFIPVESQVTFQYVFASEEYCEFVGTDFNDVFGFFVSGPGINGPFSNGAINVARLPVTNEPVSINTVNHNTNQNNYVKNELTDDVANCDIIYDPEQIEVLEYDGLTKPLVARIEVVPCETYHIRLVVGDVGDDKLDSAVFLRASSFDLGDVPTIDALVSNREDSVAYENCLEGKFVFTRPDRSVNNRPLEINFEIDEMSTAEEGIDFSSIPRSITIPAGENAVELNIETSLDGEVEAAESLILNIILSGSCECLEGGSATLMIADPIPPEILFTSIYACAGQPFTIMPQIENGVLPINYRWNDNSIESSLQSVIQAPTNYSLTVTDLCSNQTSDSIQVNIQAVPAADLSGSIDFCTGIEDVTLPIIYNGYAPWSFTYQVNNNIPITITDIYESDFSLPISESGNYQLIQFSDAACEGVVTGVGVVNDTGIEIDVVTVPPSCPTTSDGQINLNIQASPPYEINWSPMVNDLINPSDLSTGVYEIIIRDMRGCEFIDSILMTATDLSEAECQNSKIYTANIFTPNDKSGNYLFYLQGDLPYDIAQFHIYDRWGNLIFQKRDSYVNRFEEGWDGTYQGRECEQGVYLWTAVIRYKSGETEMVSGSITLMK